MADEWPAMTLREANVALIDCDHRTPPAADTGYPYVAIPQLREGRVDLSGVRRISREHFLEWTRKARPSAGDVILSRRCNPGETAAAPPGVECALGQNLVLLRADGTNVLKLGDLLELAYGKALKAEDRHLGNVPVYGSNGQVGWHDERLAAGPGTVVGRKGNPE